MQQSEKNLHKVGETVVYRRKGVYVISDIVTQEIGFESKDYYVLASVYDKNSTVYVPVDSQALTSMMERVLSKEEIHAVIEKSKSYDPQWIENGYQRAEFFEETLKSGDLAKILSVLRMIIIRKNNTDKKFYRIPARDEKAFTAFNKAITESFAYPLGLEKAEVIPYITKYMTENKE